MNAGDWLTPTVTARREMWVRVSRVIEITGAARDRA